MSHHAYGTTVRIGVEFTNGVDGNGDTIYVDPSAVAVKVRKPDESVTTHTYGSGTDPLTRDAAGQYHLDVTLSAEGVWRWRVEATGTHAGTAEGQMTVPETPFY